ncbi:MAG TPA: aminoacyl-tRNA hydrolase [Anaerolineaceae bacterium]|jgi:PTH1 family peptidyl-tRNA hydrolase|nr:aminoacyl-tRNA hydrolase [Anaerolineaceae bacterium]
MENDRQDPFLIVGLGNPGIKYRETRHNFGFMVLDALADELNIPLKKLKYKAMIGEGRLNDAKLILARPLTYMNNSGDAVWQLAKFFKVPHEHIMVAHDDLDLPLGVLRLRPGGGASGQRGVASIIQKLGTQDFPRVRLGISRPPGQMDPVDYVLEKFLPSEKTLRDIVIKEAVAAIQVFVREGLNAAMNRYNGDVSGT